MQKNINMTILSLTLSSILAGCGSSSTTNTSSGADVGKAYYLDSAVAGVAYKCGTQEGITGIDGSFLFTKGEGCQFYVGDLLLKDIPASHLQDGKKIIEEDATVASLLQTLDSDGNAENGIEITQSVVAALKENGIKKLPQTESELTDVWSALKQKSDYKGRIIDKESAMAHVQQTKKKYQGNSDGMHEQRSAVAYFGDKEQNRIVVVDIDGMKLIDEIATGHQKTYAAEVIKTHGKHELYPKMYIDNRGSDAIDVLDSQTNEIVKTIALPFHPRSISVNKETGLVAVSGVDKPMIAIIDSKSDELIATVGKNEVTYPVTSGHDYVSSGTLACGHPEWLNENHFVLVDRQNREISTYKIEKDATGKWQTTLINSVATPSPVHNLIPPKIHGQAGHKMRNGRSSDDFLRAEGHQGGHKGGSQSGHMGKELYSTVFYATAEGATDVYPSVLKLEFTEGDGLKIVDNLEIKKEGLSPNIMGVHHLNFLKDQKHIYVGSDEGNLFIVRYDTTPMQIEKIVPAGKGAGHTDEFKHGNIAVVINHKDRFITLMNTMTNTKIADINVSQVDETLIGKVQTQSHPQYHFSKDGRYFYIFLTEEGALVKVDLTQKEVVERLEIGGKIAMGSFLGH
jgi:DNA-binding beta-propeller fold protein YncE